MFRRRRSSSLSRDSPQPLDSSFLDMSSSSGSTAAIPALSGHNSSTFDGHKSSGSRSFRIPGISSFAKGAESNSSKSYYSDPATNTSGRRPSLPRLQDALPEFYQSATSASSRPPSPASSVRSSRTTADPAPSWLRQSSQWTSSNASSRSQSSFQSESLQQRRNTVAEPFMTMTTFSPHQPPSSVAPGMMVDEKKTSAPRKRTGERRKLNPSACMCCNTTQTAEWRKGPAGLRTLCNACGLVAAKSNLAPPKSLEQAIEQVEAIGRARFRVAIFELPEEARERAAITFIPPEGGIDPSTVTLGPPSSYSSANSRSSSAATTPADVEAAMGLEALSRGRSSSRSSVPQSSVSGTFSGGMPSPAFSSSSPYTSMSSPHSPYGGHSSGHRSMAMSKYGLPHPYSYNAQQYPAGPVYGYGIPASTAAPNAQAIPSSATEASFAGRASPQSSRRSSFTLGSASRPTMQPPFRFV